MKEFKMDISTWFGFSYSSYLVIPRLMLQSMPAEWQYKFTELLQEANDRLIIDNNYPNNYMVKLRGKDGKFIADKYRDYRHGKNLELRDE